MDKETRKANFRKLQQPPPQPPAARVRTTRSSAKAATTISNYFLTPKKINDAAPPPAASTTSAEKPKNLTNFIYNNKNETGEIPHKKLRESDLFEKAQAKAKRAPKFKNSSNANKKGRAKGQPNIKSAFLRNEQLFAEITAQHCMADNFSPDDIEMALAISKSEAESNGLVNAIETEVVVDLNARDSIRNKLQKFGFRTAAKEDYNALSAACLAGNKRAKRAKWANKFTALTLRNAEVQAKKLNSNIENFFAQQCITEPLNDEQIACMRPYKILTKDIKQYKASDDSLILGNSKERSTAELSNFYVKDLCEMSTIPAGHLLKNWAKIQGRDLSPGPESKRSKESIRLMNKAYAELATHLLGDKTTMTTTTCNEKPNDEVLATEVNETSCHQDMTTVSACIAAALVSPIDEQQMDVDDGEQELDELINLLKEEDVNTKALSAAATAILNSSADEEPPDKRARFPTEIIKENTNMPNKAYLAPPTQTTRSTSPDIFADSDDDGDFDMLPVEVAATKTILNVSINEKRDITTFEMYSSDEVKTLSSNCDKEQTFQLETVEDIIDLTQNNSEEYESIETKILNLDYRQQKADIECSLKDSLKNTKTSLNISFNDTAEVQQNADFSKITLYEKENSDAMNIETVLQADFADLDMPEARITPQKFIDNENKKLKLSLNEIEFTASEFETKQSNVLQKNEEKSFHLNNKTANITNCNDDTFFKDLYQQFGLTEHIKAHRKGTQSSLNEIQTSTITANRSLRKTKSFRCNNNNKTIFELEALTKSMSPKTNSFSIEDSNDDDNDDNDADDDDTADEVDNCILLSDDEINYSIWKADKTLNSKRNELNTTACSKQNFSLLDDLETSRNAKVISFQSNLSIDLTQNDSDDDLHWKEENKAFTPAENQKSINSILGELNMEKTTTTPQKISKNVSNLSFDYDPEMEAFLISSQTSNKSGNSRSPNKSALSRERAEFGILDAALSEPFTLTQLPTPTEAEPAEHEQINWQEVSFLDSPSEQVNIAKQRHSSIGANKFSNFIEQAPAAGCSQKNNDIQDDLDEFDRLVFGAMGIVSNNSTNNKVTAVPSGLDQLLTGEMSLEMLEQKYVHGKTQTESKALTKKVVPEKLQVNGSTYNVRISQTPKPDFMQLSEAELLQQLYNYGIKPLKRKQAIKMLEFIYNQTHPIMLAAAESGEEEQQQQQQPHAWSKSKSTPIIGSNKNNKLNQITLTQIEATASTMLNTPPAPPATAKLLLQDAFGAQLLRYSHTLQATLVADDEYYVLQTNVSKKTAQPLLPLHIAWHNLLLANPMLHESVLMYEPIDLQEIYLFLKSLGYRYEPKELKTFFDRRCVIFRYELNPTVGAGKKASERHTRKPKARKR